MSHYTDQNQISEQAWLNSVLGQMGLQKSSNNNHDGINEVGEIPLTAGAAQAPAQAPAAENMGVSLPMLYKKLEFVSETLREIAEAFTSSNPLMKPVINKLEDELEDVRVGIAKANFFLKNKTQIR